MTGFIARARGRPSAQSLLSIYWSQTKMRLRVTTAVLLFACSIAFCFAQTPHSKLPSDDDNGGIVYGKDHVFGIVAPPGWVLDNSTGVSQGLYAVFYPKGGSWQRSPVVMYANVIHKGEAKVKPMQEIVAADVEEFEGRSKAPVVTDDPQLVTKSDAKAVVKRFVDATRSIYEVVAYIDEPKVVVMLVMSAQSEDGAAKALPAFKTLVGSYFFMTSDVRVK